MFYLRTYYQAIYQVEKATPLTKLRKEKKRILKYSHIMTHNLRLFLHFPTSTYTVKREYLIYTNDSFVADVGGYLGLLLGHRLGKLNLELPTVFYNTGFCSALSLFYKMSQWYRRRTNN